MLDDERRGVEETYLVASTSSSLRVQADRRGDSDIIIAAGWTESRVGMALMRLHSEWDRTQKPPKPSDQAIAALALTMSTVLIQEGKEPKTLSKAERHEMARQRAQTWYMGEMGTLVGRLSSLASVRQQLCGYALSWSIEDAEIKVPLIIRYWLDQTCPRCNGLGLLQVGSTPSLSAKACRVCNGSGITSVPYGSDGRRLANYMDDCVSIAQTALRKRLRGLMSRA